MAIERKKIDEAVKAFMDEIGLDEYVEKLMVESEKDPEVLRYEADFFSESMRENIRDHEGFNEKESN